jgi:hypothetical protein
MFFVPASLAASVHQLYQERALLVPQKSVVELQEATSWQWSVATTKSL